MFHFFMICTVVYRLVSLSCSDLMGGTGTTVGGTEAYWGMMSPHPPPSWETLPDQQSRCMKCWIRILIAFLNVSVYMAVYIVMDHCYGYFCSADLWFDGFLIPTWIVCKGITKTKNSVPISWTDRKLFLKRQKSWSNKISQVNSGREADYRGASRGTGVACGQRGTHDAPWSVPGAPVTTHIRPLDPQVPPLALAWLSAEISHGEPCHKHVPCLGCMSCSGRDVCFESGVGFCMFSLLFFISLWFLQTSKLHVFHSLSPSCAKDMHSLKSAKLHISTYGIVFMHVIVMGDIYKYKYILVT